MLQPTLRKIDCVRLFVPDLDAALTYYEGQLGLRLVWRSEVAIGLAFPETDAELVIQTERPGLEVDILVDSADRAADAVRQAGGRVVVPPFDIRIGRCVVVHEATRTGGFGAELSAQVQENCFLHLEAEIVRVAGWDTPYPHAFEWEYFPGPERIKRAIQKVMAG